jgi:transposase
MGNSQTSFTIIHAHSAGIDVGSRSHLVAIDQNKVHVREFGVYTKDHQQLIDHLRLHGITTIAMESTGSYWLTLFTALQQAGFEAMLVSASQTKNVKRRGPCRSKNRRDRLHLDSEIALLGLAIG